MTPAPRPKTRWEDPTLMGAPTWKKYNDPQLCSCLRGFCYRKYCPEAQAKAFLKKIARQSLDK